MVKKVAVLGAGVMGSQIAAHCVNAGLSVVLFDIPGPGDPNQIVAKAIKGLVELSPPPLAISALNTFIEPANYDEHLQLLRGCDLVIEAIAERLDWKEALYQRIAPFIAPETVIASNTSGLSINHLAQRLPQQLRSRFCGVHFFNPPRYMQLVELIPACQTEPGLVDVLESWLVTCLGKSVVRAKDTPNFIANRVGVFAFLATMHHAARFGIPLDEVDALTGPVIGRPRSATFRTIDVVGLDTLANVIRNMHLTLENDPWRPYYKVPGWMQALIERGALGQKTRQGIYRKDGRQFQVLDSTSLEYRVADGVITAEVADILLLKDARQRMAALAASSHRQAQFLWALFRDIFHYCAVHLPSIADNARDVDLAMRWGYGWAHGAFESWEEAGWGAVASLLQ